MDRLELLNVLLFLCTRFVLVVSSLVQIVLVVFRVQQEHFRITTAWPVKFAQMVHTV